MTRSCGKLKERKVVIEALEKRVATANLITTVEQVFRLKKGFEK